MLARRGWESRAARWIIFTNSITRWPRADLRTCSQLPSSLPPRRGMHLGRHSLQGLWLVPLAPLRVGANPPPAGAKPAAPWQLHRPVGSVGHRPGTRLVAAADTATSWSS